ncbi:MAG TPA: ABC-F family ATP-binding cassette domain-containing protein [Stenotrophomonas sp.]|jgi:ATPase subunit of ABC transporter with duplicated ATPase domains
MSPARIRVAQLHFSWPDGTPVFDGLSFTLGPSRTGLVAANGGGKSTLLRLLAGQLAPAAGRIEVAGRIGYLPQRLALRDGASVADVLGIAGKLQALHAIQAGDADPLHFDTLDGDWDVRERAAGLLDRLGLGGVALDRGLSSFSGGEAMSLALAAQLLQRPDVLLLDEPSNHLDQAARLRLYDVLSDWPDCLVVASHDRELLEHMQQIAVLTPRDLRLYGGGYRFYRQMLDAEQRAAEQQVRQLRGQVQREQRGRQAARERAERRAGRAARALPDAGLPRIVAGNLQRAAQVSAGKADEVHADRVADAQSRLRQASGALEDTTPPSWSLPATRVPGDRLLFAGEGLQLRRGGRDLWRPSGLSLAIRGPQRIALMGDNGVGKSSLLQLIAGDAEPDAGALQRTSGRIAWLTQRLDRLDPARTLMENFADAAPLLPEAERAGVLARLQFRGARMQLPVAQLSGGEQLRATLACLLLGEPAPQLLLLDEPTNHLDLDSVAQLEQALRAYAGALVVVSHDARFLEAILLTRRLRLDRDGLHELPS